MRTLAVDLGTRRVGLALSDAGGRLATPYDVLHVTASTQATDAILKIMEAEGVERLVVGVPMNMDGSLGPAAADAVKWGRELARCSSRPVVLIDERLSSFDAEQQLNDRKRSGEKLTRARKKKQLDAMAAASFLQMFLDGALQELLL